MKGANVKKILVIGQGPGAFGTLFSLAGKAEIIVVDKGPSIEDRVRGGKIAKGITGTGGAGLASDFKCGLAIKEIGGSLPEIIGFSETKKRIEEFQKIIFEFAGEQKIYEPKLAVYTRVKREGLKYGLKLLPNRIFHLGSDRAVDVIKNMRDHLISKGVEFQCNTEVVNIEKRDNKFYANCTNLKTGQNSIVEADYIAAFPGRSSSNSFSEIAQKIGVELSGEVPIIDLGCRLETSMEVVEGLKDFYESKFIYYSKKTDRKVRLFCQCPNGFVSIEHHSQNGNEFATVNGYSSAKEKSNCCNFAILVSERFSFPFRDAYGYGRSIAQLFNALGGDKKIICQTFSDLVRNKRSTIDRISRLTFEPTLSAEPGSAQLALPGMFLDSIIEFIQALDNILPGLAFDSLLYFPEVKYYNTKMKLSNELETTVPGFYCGGDGSGATRSISMAMASGLHIGECILRK